MARSKKPPPASPPGDLGPGWVDRTPPPTGGEGPRPRRMSKPTLEGFVYRGNAASHASRRLDRVLADLPEELPPDDTEGEP